MKKIILSFVLIIGLMFSTAFSYNLNTKDTQLVNKINRKFDLIYKKSPQKIEDIYEKVQDLLNKKLKGKENSRIYNIISALNIHLEEILNKNEEKIDLDNLLFGEEKDKESFKEINKEQIIERINNGEHCSNFTRKQSNDVKNMCFEEELKIYIKKGGKCLELKNNPINKKKCLSLEETYNKEKEQNKYLKYYTDIEMKDFIDDGGVCHSFKKYSLNERKCISEKKKRNKKVYNYNSYLNNNYSSGRKGVYKNCHTGPRGGRYYINSKGRKVYNCD